MLRFYTTFILLVFYVLTIKAQTNPSSDSLLHVLKNATNDSSRLSAMEKLFMHYRSANSDSDQIILDKALVLARASNNKKAEANFLTKQGTILRINKTDLTRAIQTYQQALRIAESVHDTTWWSDIYTGIGRIQAEQGNNEEAETAFRNAVQWAQNPVKRYHGLESLAVLYANQKKINQAEKVFEQALSTVKQNRETQIYWIRVHSNVAFFYANFMKDTTKALWYNREATKGFVDDPKRDLVRYIIDCEFISQSFFTLGDYTSSALYAKKITPFRHIDKNNVKHSVAKAYRRLFDIYEKQGQYRQATLYADSMLVLRDSLDALTNSDSLKRETYKLDAAFKLERKQKEVELLAQKQKTQMVWMIAISLVALLLGVLIFVIQRNKRRIEMQKTELANLNTTKDKLFALLSHDLISPVDTLKNYTMLMDWGAMNQSTFATAMETLKILLNNTSNMLENVLHWAISQMTELKPKKEVVNISAIVAEQIDLVSPIANDKRIDIQQLVPNDLMIELDKNHLALAIRNLLQNALKFTKPSGHITVSAQNTEGGQKTISIQDSGIGMTPDILSQLFQIDKNTNRKGTSQEKGTGLGLILTKELVELNKGQINVSSEVNKGTRFDIIFNT
ncbi:MAG: hypothetical protein JNL70_01400 [Saprospiraceae bacterium]|nr:hypothetical protein [Saprospiraceae bacterium]